MTRYGVAVLALALLPQAAHAGGRAGAEARATVSAQPEQPRVSEEVADTLRAMYAAAQKDDLEAFHALVTPGFYAFDNGSRFEGDALMRMVIQYHRSGFKAVWAVTKPDVHISGDHAWITYINVGSLQMSADAPVVPTEWLESAELEWQGGRWKIAFFHSTRVPSETAAH